jgi:hypothetical protein
MSRFPFSYAVSHIFFLAALYFGPDKIERAVYYLLIAIFFMLVHIAGTKRQKGSEQ